MKRKTALGGVITALIYTRVSGREQEREGLSLPAQLADCRRYAQSNDWIIGAEFQDVMKGTRDDRPQYQALLAEARQLRRDGQNAVVVVKWLHRLGRRVLESVRCREEFATIGVTIHSVNDGGPVNDFVANIMASTAQYEVQQLGERVSSVWQHTTGLGWAMIGRVPWGYQLRPATAEERAAGSPKVVLAVAPDSAPYVVEAFQRLANGESGRGVARWAARLPHEARGGRVVSWRTMGRILRSPLYAGRPFHGEDDVLERSVAKWPALVGDDVWQAVQDRLNSHERMPHQASGKYLLVGLLRCPVCGGRMHGGSPAQTRRYRCAGVHPDEQCSQTAACAQVDQLVLTEVGAALERITSDPRVQAALKRAWQGHQTTDGGNIGQQIRRLEAHLQRARERIRRGTELLVDGTIDKQAYDDLREKAQKDSENAEKELASLRREVQPARTKLPPLEHVLGAAGDWTTVLQGADVEPQRDVLALLVERVVPIRERQGIYRVEITWTPLGEALRSLTAP